MDDQQKSRSGFPWLEMLLIVALLTLVLQLFPQWGQIVLSMVNPKNWPRTVWFAANLFIVLTLLAVRFGPGLIQDWQEQNARRETQRQEQTKQQELKAQRDALVRMQQAKRRRIY